ncbi:hypothetical protein FOZ61_009662 [Perkinsus olseni]|uniref:VPS9 domain-containing protein n=1 Tax=Perkinsus olseni TaxID=32597 RepID=A0A7J6KZX5_PEROL|nr:hypothetical protein FOZ61_009662 [Perkinsus olseni]
MTLSSSSSSSLEEHPIIPTNAISKVDAILADDDEEDDDEDDGDVLIEDSPVAVKDGRGSTTEETVDPQGPRIVDLTVITSPTVTAVDDAASPERDGGSGRGILSGVLGRVQQPVAWIRRRRSDEGGPVGIKEAEEETINNDPLGFKAFLELLHDHPALGRKLVFERVASLKQKWPAEGGLSRQRASRMLHKFLVSLESGLLSLPPLDKAGPDRRRDACEALEKFVILEMDAPVTTDENKAAQEPRRLLFDMDPRDRDADAALDRKLAALSWLSLTRHLEGPSIEEKDLEMAVKQLGLMSKYRAPRDKLVCLLNACRVITRTLESSDGGSADDILPTLIWVLIKARPSRLRSNINFIQAFRPPQRLSSGEDGYYFTMLTSAATFITGVSHTSIAGLTPGREADEYRLECKAALEQKGFPYPDSGPDICLDWGIVLDRDIRPLLRDRKPGIAAQVKDAEDLTLRQVRQLLDEQHEFCDLFKVLDEKLWVRKDMNSEE